MYRVLTATALGVVVGLVFSDHTEYSVVFGRIYANLLQAFVIPLLLFSIIYTVSSLKDLKTLSSMGGKTIGVLALHNVLGSIIAIVVGRLMNLGFGSQLKLPVGEEVTEAPHFSEVIISFFPKNIVDNMVNNNIIPIIIFALIIGVSILIYKDKEEIHSFTSFIEAGHHLMVNIIGKAVTLTPYAVLSLISNQIGSLNLSFVTSLLVLLLAVYIVCLFHTFATTTGMVGLMAKVNPFIFQKKFFPAWLIGFTTQSSIGAIPANIRSQQSMGYQKK